MDIITQKDIRILVITSNESIHSDFKAALDEGSIGENYTVDFASNMPEALEMAEEAMLENHPYQLAFINAQTLTKRDALETVGQIGREYPELQVIICTSHSDTSWKEKIGQSGWSDKLLTLTLPFDNFEVKQILFSLSEKNLLRNQLDQMKGRQTKLTTRITQLQENLQQAEEHGEKMKKAAERGPKFLGRYLANISHEIRTPLNAIIGFSDGILQANSIETVGKHAQVILNESEHLLRLINEMLDHAKIEAGKIDLENRPVDLLWLLESVVSSSSVLAKNKELKLNVSKESNVPQYITGDSLRIRQILMNLVNNAVKFTEHGSVSIHVEAPVLEEGQTGVRFSITDTGMGIAKDKQEMIFESFTQADVSTTRKFGGTGLGTSISKQLVEMMGGQIGLESEPGNGSTFWFDIPYDECEEPTEDDQLALVSEHRGFEPEHVKNIHILIVEDYEPNQDVAKLHLENSGHTVDIACNGQEAVDMCENNTYELIIMDVQMPVMDGYDATKNIRSGASSCRNIPIMGLTANAEKDTQQACLEAGMNDVATKPIRRKPLLNAINKLISQTDGDSTASSDRESPHDAPGETQKKNEPLDYESAAEEFGSIEVVKELSGRLIDNIEKQIKIMKEAMETNDMESLRRESHSVKGGAATLEAMPISEIAKQLEELSKTSKIDEIPDVFENFINEFERLREFVSDFSQLKKINSESDDKKLNT